MKKNSGCPSNIGEKEKQKRLTFGWMMLAVSIVSVFALHSSSAGSPYRAILFIPVFFTCLGFIQFQQKVCVFHGLRNTQNLDGGDKKIADLSLAEVLRKTSMRILLLTAGIAGAITLVFLLTP